MEAELYKDAIGVVIDHSTNKRILVRNEAEKTIEMRHRISRGHDVSYMGFKPITFGKKEKKDEN